MNLALLLIGKHRDIFAKSYTQITTILPKPLSNAKRMSYMHVGDQSICLFSDLRRKTWKRTDVPTDHCLEAIRLSAMCTPDLTPHSLYWEHIESPKVAARPDVPRDCVNWDMLGSWMEARAYTLADLVKANARQGK